MQKARCHPEGLQPLVSARFQVYFTPLLGVLFTFPSRYLFTIGLPGVFSLPDGPGRFRQGFTCPALLRIPLPYITLPVQGFHLLRPHFPMCSNSVIYRCCGPTTPKTPKRLRFGLIPFRSPLLRKSLLFSLPPTT